ncbi:DUF4179 domain-containing protein [Cytobacillus solani]|uniref:DUF4179 domain-containing protein n=1 Tax=Cytobacillus solani TaxID=1637975 RepID=A0A0Q3VI49_9BACI|nr:DUF4179 domain-containing protein [Cytobacillus solani]KQL19675.1 hypothetical protein AN957_14600 [Cytobacillus solani]
MGCHAADKLSQYVDELLIEQEQVKIHNHIKNCGDCLRVVNAFKEEQQFLKETLQTPPLPDHFSEMILDQLEPYEHKIVSKKRKPWKRIMYSAAAILLTLGLGTALSPSFAEWIGGLFSTDQVDDGLRMASEAGLAERVNLEVKNNGLTFKVEDVVADTSRIALSFQVLSEKGEPQDTYLDIPESRNKITAIDQNGKTLNHLGSGWTEGSDYGLVELSLREQPALDKVTIMFDLVELNGVKGSWKLNVPVDLKDNRKYTTTLPLKEAKISTDGVAIQMKEVRFAPSSNELLYETAFTKEERTRVATEIDMLKRKFGEGNIHSFTNYGTAIQYHIENEQGEAVYYHNTFMEGKGHPSGEGLIQGSGQDMEQLGQVMWNESFIPQKNDQNLTFVLDGVTKTVPSNFSIKVKPKEFKNTPVKFEYEGNYMTIKEADTKNKLSLRKSLIPIEKETTFTIEMEGGKELPGSDLGDWVITDNKGKVYQAFHSGSVLNEKDKNGRYKTTIELKVYDINEIPEEVTLHLLSVTRYYDVEDKWEIPLY